MLKLTGLKKNYESEGNVVEVLRGIDLEVDEGQALAVVGPSGCGKSTLLHIIGTLDEPTEGQVEINQRNPFMLSDKELAKFRNSVVGFVFQDHHLLPQLSVVENVLMPTLAFSSGGSQLQRAHELLKKVGLEKRIQHRPAQLSGGERQRVAVARALINRPSLLLCDEPTGSLDSKNAEAVADVLFELHRDQKTVLICVTHSRELADRFPVQYELRDGKCVQLQ
ncbi:MAG TPA: ABC transporter ATP-binding protein [Acidobacteriota bacterium]|nr:ABC transporter ATP-binding protein [Acidobacteriota bacterium]